jgi:hypothetical protein
LGKIGILGKNWNTCEKFGKSWNTCEKFGKNWNTCEKFGILGKNLDGLLAIKKMEYMGNLGKIWEKLEYLGKIGILAKNLGKIGLLEKNVVFGIHNNFFFNCLAPRAGHMIRRSEDLPSKKNDDKISLNTAVII